ncbi:hypothetical protein EUTSA_v10000449mg [Eutrema salsugineum]|uniref:RBR-type E3 ubiquitin transferase n=1 Tax=Eutrema salsugineum TaxID=72664 RepID=V4M351_EUTSA|nr:uncharacterized protein LOC18022266 [Eutrema salsugineum]ESQ46663.1 hypothetical protein EUTSA_v10000449mg [Eutrema salsugineum]
MEKHRSDLIFKRPRLDAEVTGDTSNPKDEGSFKVVNFLDDVVYRLYFKGLVNDETVADGGERTITAGYGVAICDGNDNLLYEIKETLSDGGQISRRGVEIKALIRGLSEAFDLGIRHVMIYCDDYQIFQLINGGDKPTQNKNLQLLKELCRLREKMASSDPLLVARSDVKFAFKLAREATTSQSSTVDAKPEQGETCTICLEEIEKGRMFFTDKCIHRHCFSCVKQYVEVKLLSGIVPTCLGEGCKLELTLESCSKILTTRVIEMWKRKMKEDSIPPSERIYCPYQNCSMLMSKAELSSSDGSDQSNVRECVKCCGLFCIDCKVPSHTDLSCADYKKLHPDPLVDDMKLKSLANDNRWRQCLKCRHLIELSHGCNHMTCRCGYEFCYKCGVEWKKNQQTCPSGCLLTGHGDYDDEDDDDDDDDDSEHSCEKDMCQCYYDDDGGRWRNFEDFIDHQTPVHVIYSPLPPDVVQEYQFTPEHISTGEGNGDGYDDYGDYNYGGLTESDDEGGFEDFYRDYYSL